MCRWLQEATAQIFQVVNMHLIQVGNKLLHGNCRNAFLQGKLTKLGETWWNSICLIYVIYMLIIY